jgi:Tol biopolymer transport system component/predicted Ser/Thr protein kinase
MTLTSGTKLGPYEIVAPLGAGGMSEVYRARDTRLDREVAIKVLPSHLSENPEFRARFEREAKTISGMQHPNICVLHDVGRQDGVDFLVMEYLDGETLATRLARKPLTSDDTLRIGIEVADALDKAHRSGIVHRDLKPGNVMLTKVGTTKLLDFGLAKLHSLASGAQSAAPAFSAVATVASMASPVTVAGTVVGTMQYMSPEQIQGKEADARSDIFAFGAMLYEMLTSKRAFQGKSQLSVASAVLEKDPEPISAVQPLTPPALEHLVRICLAKEPDQRFQSAHDLKLQLQWITAGGSQVGAPPVVVSQRKSPQKIMAAAMLAGWVAAIAGAVLAMLLSSQVRQAQRPVTAEINSPPGADFTGAVRGPAVISPDGKELAFSAGDPKGSRLWMRDLATGRTEVLEGTDEALFPFWSPDSRALAFFSSGKLRKVSVGGGPVQILCDAPEGRGGSWSANGTIIFTPNITESLYHVSEGGGTPEKLTQAKPGWTHRNPYFLPDGEHFLFIAREPAGTATAGSLYAASLKGEEPKLVLERASNVQYSGGYLLYLKDANLVAQPFDASGLKLTGNPISIAEKLDYWNARDAAYFSASPNGVLLYRKSVQAPAQPTLVDREGKEMGKVGEPGIYFFPRFSPDGSKLALARAGKDSLRFDVWITDLQHNSSSRATFVDSPEVVAAFSPDGNTLAVSANVGGARGELWTQSVSGSGAQETITDTPIWMTLGDWSRDGRYLFGDVQENKTREDIFFVDLKGDRKLTKFLQSPASELAPMLSPNGKWLAYVSDESGRYEVYVTAFPGPGRKWQVSSGGVGGVSSGLSWSSDGKELYFASADKIMVAPIQNTESFQFGTPQALPMPTADLFGFTPSPTPGRFLVLRRTGPPELSPIRIVLNWTETLKK